MDTKRITIIGIIAVVIIIVAAAAVVISDDDDDDTKPSNGGTDTPVVPDKGDDTYTPARTDGRLMIYGNADNDDYLDSHDVDYIQDIIDGKKTVTKFADANCDGVVDSKDLEMVKRMVNRESMTIYYHNPLTDSSDAVSYPVKTIVPIVNETTVAMKILGKVSDFAATYKVPDTRLFSDVDPSIPIITGSGKIDLEVLSGTKCDAVVTMPAEKYVTNEDAIEKAGIQVLRFDFRDPDCASAYLTAGYILGAEERSHQYAEFSDRVLGDIQEKTKNVDKVVAGVFGYNVIYGNTSGYGNMVVAAGGINGVDWTEHRKVSDGYEWLYNYKFDWICGRVSSGGYDYDASNASDVADVKDKWDKHYNVYKLTDAVSQGHLMLLNTSTPDVIKAVYMAEQFYPSLFESGYADAIHQEYVDKFIDNLHSEGYKVTDGEFCITQSDVAA